MNKKDTLASSNDSKLGSSRVTFLSTLLIQSLVGVLGFDSLLTGIACIRTALSVGTLELVDSSTSRVLIRGDVGVEASVLVVGGAESTLADVAAVRLGVLVSAGHLVDV